MFSASWLGLDTLMPVGLLHHTYGLNLPAELHVLVEEITHGIDKYNARLFNAERLIDRGLTRSCKLPGPDHMAVNHFGQPGILYLVPCSPTSQRGSSHSSSYIRQSGCCNPRMGSRYVQSTQCRCFGFSSDSLFFSPPLACQIFPPRQLQSSGTGQIMPKYIILLGFSNCSHKRHNSNILCNASSSIFKRATLHA